MNTWNGAAQAAANIIIRVADQNLNEFAKQTQDELTTCLRFEVDDLIHSFWNVAHPSQTGILPFWKSTGMLALFAGRKPLSEIVALLCSKQHDYGHHNIARFGHRGLIVRVHDKVARIENLLRRQIAAGLVGYSAAGESPWLCEPLQDSFDDVLGYSIIGVMLCEGTFMLPLAA